MLFTVGEREFNDLVREKEDIINARGGYAAPLMVAISAKWMSALDAPATLILIYLVTRTFVAGKGAERIAVREFLEGTKQSEDYVFAALPMSLNTFRKHIKHLCDVDLVTIYSVRSMLEGTESQPRMFEINCKKMLDVPALALGRDQFIEQIEHAIAEEKRGNALPKLLGVSL